MSIRLAGFHVRRIGQHACGTYCARAATTPRRSLLTLAIETSCDDTSVAILERRDHRNGIVTAKLHFHERITANSDKYRGIHPIAALESHQRCLGPLVEKALAHLPKYSDGDKVPGSTEIIWGSRDGELRKKPDFVSVTRGPGMRSNLSVGINLAKGLALAWNVPLIGVHHMQAHALTPRLMTSMSTETSRISPGYPFLSLLVSGGHTMLLSTSGLVDHSILATCNDIAIGDFLDKAARMIVPPDQLSSPYGASLEAYAFPDGRHDYSPPRNREEELKPRSSPWKWKLSPPLSESKGNRSSRRMEYSFSGLLTAVQRALGPAHQAGANEHELISMADEERRYLAQEVQRLVFEHLCGRVLLHLSSLDATSRASVKTLVVSGGVAANKFLRHVLRSMLDAQGYTAIVLICPPIEYCTDNAAMIAWAGCEMWRAGYRSDLAIEPIRKWVLDSSIESGGIRETSGWSQMSTLR